MTRAITLYVDADACPVKDEVYRVAARHTVPVHVVANSYIAVPRHPLLSRVVVGPAFDAADDWIAERADADAIVITSDIPLASRCVKAGAVVLTPTGRELNDSSVGMALATRNLLQDLREAGERFSGPKPFSRTDRSAFLGALDRVINRMRRQ